MVVLQLKCKIIIFSILKNIYFTVEYYNSSIVFLVLVFNNLFLVIIIFLLTINNSIAVL